MFAKAAAIFTDSFWFSSALMLSKEPRVVLGLNSTERKAATIDLLALSAGADVHHVWGMIQEGLSRVADVETMLLACCGPQKLRTR